MTVLTEHKHRLPVSVKTLVLSEEMKCKHYKECKQVYNYYTGTWKTK
jgi:hypothetical protein